MRAHGTDEQKDLFKNSTVAWKAIVKNTHESYEISPNFCKECNSPLSFQKKFNAFCSHKCSANHSNRQRKETGWSLSTDSREKISNKLSMFSGPYTKVHFKPCKFCNQNFLTTTRVQVCKNCQYLKWKNNKNQYSFKFNIFDYPDLFDLDQLKLLGWVSFGGKRGGKKNFQGLSRDHRVSVHDAKKFKYDPYYISHPLNCELMPHSANNKKKTRSSIEYLELVRLVDEYDNRGSY